MWIDRQLAAQLDVAVLDEIADFAAFAETGFLDLQERDIAEAVVDHAAVHVGWLHAGHGEGARCGLGQADLEEVGPVEQIVGAGGFACATPLM